MLLSANSKRKLLAALPLAALVGAGALEGCGKSSEENKGGQTQALFGVDDRKSWRSMPTSVQAIGKVFSPSIDTYQSGVLVGPDLVLTYGRSLVDAEGKLLETSMKFLPFANTDETEAPYTIGVTHVLMGQTVLNHFRDVPKAWALLRLSAPVGKKFGYMGTHYIEYNGIRNEEFNYAAYPKDREYGEVVYGQTNCHILGRLKFAPSMFASDCDFFYGDASDRDGTPRKNQAGGQGGPIWTHIANGPHVVGLMIGPDDNEHGKQVSIAIGAENFGSAVQDMRSNNLGKDFLTRAWVCNRTSEATISYAYVSHEQNNWTGRGWFSVKRNMCREITLAQNYNGDIYLGALTGSGRWLGGDQNFCLNSKDRFTIARADYAPCSEPGMTRKGFRKLSVKLDAFNEMAFTDQ